MKKIGILTSGGDCSTMNKVITTFVQVCEHNQIEPYLIYNGYEGLTKGEIRKTNWNEVRTWYDLPGSKIYSSRFPEFENLETRKKAVLQLQKHHIDGLIVCGGNGSYIGASKLAELGIKIITLPGTIDNDVSSSETTIGFHSSLDYVVKTIRSIRATMESHHFVSIVEIMGRNCPDLTIFAGIATHADYIITGENIKTPEELGSIIAKLKKLNPANSILILVTELLYGTNNFPSLEDTCKIATKISGEKIRINVLSYAQRGSDPSAWDLINSTRMTTAAVNLMKSGKNNVAIGNKGNEVVAIDLLDAINLKSPSRKKFIEKFINLEKI